MQENDQKCNLLENYHQMGKGKYEKSTRSTSTNPTLVLYELDERTEKICPQYGTTKIVLR